MPMSTGAASLDILAQGKAAERAVLSKQDHSTSIIFFLELPGEGMALVSWAAFWGKNVIFLE